MQTRARDAEIINAVYKTCAHILTDEGIEEVVGSRRHRERRGKKLRGWMDSVSSAWVGGAGGRSEDGLELGRSLVMSVGEDIVH